jgi:UDP-N-acetylmuramoyl-tripeptide--D-alanyl-D-alanine ligase
MIKRRGEKFLSVKHDLVSEAQLYSVAAAAAIGDACGMTPGEINEALAAVQPVAGRMQRLDGIKKSIILDDTYNASPEAARLAMDTLYQIKAPQRIAVLGNMNEMGDYSEQAHKEVGSYCDPKKLDLVITLGQDANKYLAAEARARGCQVVTCDSPYDVAEEVKKVLKEGALVLVKGSQNRVFAEEAVKLLLADPADVDKLVRQSDYWLRVKEKQFGKVPS